MGQPQPLIGLFLVFSNKHHYNFYNRYMWKMSIQYKVPGFEPMTFRTWVSSHNHNRWVVPQFFDSEERLTLLIWETSRLHIWAINILMLAPETVPETVWLSQWRREKRGDEQTREMAKPGQSDATAPARGHKRDSLSGLNQTHEGCCCCC